MDNQVRNVSKSVTTLVQDVDDRAARERKSSLKTIEGARQKALEILFIFWISTLVAAAMLAATATQSIAWLLGQLAAGAQALGSGDFGHRVETAGSDELTILGRAHNEAATQLSELYAALSRSEAHYRSLIENAGDLIMVVDVRGEI